VNWAKTTFSESFPELWLFGLGALFIAVVMAFPNGLAGVWAQHIEPRLLKLWPGSAKQPAAPAAEKTPAE